MADKKFNIVFDVDANIGPVKTAVSNLQSALSKINVPDSFKKGLTDTFTKLDNEIKNFESIASKGFTNLADVNKAEKSFDRVTDLLSKLKTEAARLKGVDPNKLLPKETIDKTKALHSEWVKLKAIIDKGFGNTAEIAKQTAALNKQRDSVKQLEDEQKRLQELKAGKEGDKNSIADNLAKATAEAEKLQKAMRQVELHGETKNNTNYSQKKQRLTELNKEISSYNGQLRAADKEIDKFDNKLRANSIDLEQNRNKVIELETQLKALEDAAQQTPEGLNQLREKLAEITGVNLDEIPTDIDAIGKIIQGLNTKQIEELRKQFEALEPPLKETDGAIQKVGKDFSATADQAGELTAREKEIEQLANRVKYFFSIGNTVQLFKRAVKSAINTVKELDEVMTQAAVVTKFDVSGMWAQLPEYTKRANELGVTVKGVYEASTLYYQQGLETEQVIGVTNETLKMAKIAGLDYATATNYMTSALRGFNMEVNELSAQKVNDIYSQLAAKTASNVEEISIAMSKVAPLAHNAGMEIETTAAMLAQMIEKTREAPETLGTAMKTVIARFQELKKDPALIEPIEGEMVDANKVETALNTIGVALRDTSGQFRQLDEVFLEISQKWDSLDVNTQRYIATIAAGSRQQSRFIAMMADYARTTNLVNLANNAAGASAEQFEKTQASLATALNRLKNAWDQFAMGLANNQIIKIAIDLITDFINIVNKTINALSGGSGLVKSILNLGALLGGIKLARAAFNGFFGWLLKTSKVVGLKSGSDIGKGFSGGISKALITIKKLFKGTTWINTGHIVDTKSIVDAKTKMEELRKTIALTKNNLGERPSDSFLKLNKATKDYQVALEEVGKTLGLTNAQQATSNALQALGITEGTANAAAVGGLTEEKAKEYIATEMANGASEEEARRRLKNISLLYAETGAQKQNNTVQQVGILTKLQAIGTLLFSANAEKRKAAADLLMANTTSTATAAQTALNTAIMACPIGWILAAIAAVIVLAVAVAKIAENNSLEKRIERVQEQTKEAKKVADDAKQSYEDLLNTKSEYEDLQQQLEDLTYGTIEWKEALIEANQQVLELLKTYPSLAKFLTKGAYGQLQIDKQGFDELTRIAKQTVTETAGGVVSAQIELLKLQNQVAERELAINFNNRFGYGWSTVVSSQTVNEGKTVAEAQESILTNWEEWGATSKEIEEAKLALQEYSQALAENRLQMEKNVSALLSASLDTDVSAQLGVETADNINKAFTKSFLDEENKITPKLLSDVTDPEETFENLAKEYAIQIAALGKNASSLNKNKQEDIYTLYAAMSGKTVEAIYEQFGKKGKGTDNVRQAIANQANAKSITKAQEAFSNQFLLLSKQAADTINLAMSEGTNYIKNQTAEKSETELKALYEANKDTYGLIYETFEEFYGYYTQAIADGKDQFKNYFDKLTKLGFEIDEESFGKNLSVNAIKGLSNKLTEVFETVGLEPAQELYNQIEEMTSGLNVEEAIAFAGAFNRINWSDIDSVKSLSDIIDDLGTVPSLATEEIDKLEQQIILLAKSAKTVDLEKLQEQIRGLGQLAYNINSGKQGRDFSEEDKNKLIEAGIAQASDFTFNFETGNFTYLGNSMDALRNAIIENTKAILGETKQQLEKNIGVAQGASTVLGNYDRYVQRVTTTTTSKLVEQGVAPEYLNTVLASMSPMINNEASKAMLQDFINTVSDQTIISQEELNKIGELSLPEQAETLQKYINLLSQQKNNLKDYQIKYDELMTDETVSNYVSEYQNEPLSDLSKKADFGDDAANKALKVMAINANIAEEAIYSLTNAQLASTIQTVQNAESFGLDTEELNAYAMALLNTESAEVDTLDKAYRIAAANKRISKGIKDLTDNYEDWYKILNNGVLDEVYRGTEEYQNALKDTKTAIQNLINSNNDLSDSWFEDEVNLNNLNKALEGDEDALKQVVISSVVDTSGITDSTGEINAAILTVLNDPSLRDMLIGTEIDLDTTSALSSLYGLLTAAGMSVESIQNAFNGIGWKATPQYEIIYDFMTGKEIPVFVGLKTEKIGDSIDLSGFNPNGTGSGSGGGGSEPEWENPYDRLYNYLKKINGELRIREQLEKRYNRLIKLNVETGQSLKENIDNQIASLQEQNRLQKIVSEERLKDIEKIQAENKDLLQYASFNKNIGVGGEVQIEWGEIQKVDEANDEELGKRIEDYISKMEEWADSRHEAIDAIEDNTDAIIELRQIGKEEYKDLEDRVLEAIISQQQNLIDEQEKINDSINEANEALTDAISKNIEKIRQDRQNQETETSLAEKERRLAYLRQDTTGSNAVEIKKLEKDLEKERQNYTDSLIDQSLNDLKEQNDAAAKQREKQIELMQSQLNWQEKTGYWVDEATRIVKEGLNSGIIDKSSKMYELLSIEEGLPSMSNASRSKWFEELQETISKAFVFEQTTENGGGIMANMRTVASAQDFAAFAGLEQQRNEKIRSQGLQDEWPETRMVESYNNGKNQSISENSNYMQDMIDFANSGNWAKVFEYAGMRDKKIGNNTTESFWIAFDKWYNAGQRWSQYASGGLADYTGPAWLDGTKSRPEMVLNARDTQNFLELRDILSSMAASGTGNSSVGNFYCDIDINVGEISNDYDVDRIAARIKQSIYEDSTYRNVNAINFLK